MRMHALTCLTCALALLLSGLQEQEVGSPRGIEFWRSIATNEYAVPQVPDDVRPYDLVVKLSGHLGSRDPELRDTLGYGISASWIYAQDLLTPEEQRALLDLWCSNLEEGLGETNGDSTLSRSFSALNLSILAAQDNRRPFLDRERFATFLEAHPRLSRARAGLTRLGTTGRVDPRHGSCRRRAEVPGSLPAPHHGRSARDLGRRRAAAPQHGGLRLRPWRVRAPRGHRRVPPRARRLPGRRATGLGGHSARGAGRDRPDVRPRRPRCS